MNAKQNIPSEVLSAFDRKVAYLKEIQADVSANSDVYQDDQGRWLCHYGCHWNANWGLICLYPDGRCFESHGLIGVKWHEVQSWIGLPVSDEQSDGPDHQISHFEHGDIRWSRITDTYEILPKDHLSWYNYRHDELLGYFRAALEISQPQRHEEALKDVQRKCIEDQFDVVLLGGFTEGKSTTLDVLCRGRELSPQGGGIKATSAVPVSIEVVRSGNTPEGMTEWAELRFKSDAEIKDEIFRAYEVDLSSTEGSCADGLRPFVSGEGNLSPIEAFREKFDLRNEEHLETLRQVVASDWQAYGTARMATSHRQQLEVLSIYLKYRATPQYEQIAARTIIPVAELGKYVYFPRDWQTRSPSGLDFDLSFEECIFAFLDSAVLHIRSQILSRLNCRVTDCPGLGASAYDNDVARRALMRADGVWFVKKCDKMLGASDLGTIFDLIKDNGRLERTGMALNLAKPHRVSLEDDPEKGTCLVNYCKDQLRKEGYGFPTFWCNARLAYLSMLARRKIEDLTSFTQSERKWLMDIVDEDDRDESWSDEQLWVEAVRGANYLCKVRDIKAIDTFNLDAVETLWRHSNMETALDVIAKIVLEQKGPSILIDNGSKKALETLRCYEQELTLAEGNAKKDAEQVKAELDLARQHMDEFVKGATDIKMRSHLWVRRSSVVKQLSSALVDFIFSAEFCQEFAKRAGETIYRLNRSFHWTKASFKNAFFNEVEPILRSLIQERFNLFVSTQWKENSNNSDVVDFFCYREELNSELRNLVTKLEQDCGPIVMGLPIPKMGDSGVDKNCSSKFNNRLASVAEPLRQGFWGDLWALLKIVCLEILWGDKSKAIEAMTNAICQKISEILDSVLLRDNLKQAVVPIFATAVDSSLSALDADIKTMQQLFRDRCDDLEADNGEKEERKREIAAANHKIRTEQVQPLREKLEAFEKTVSEELRDVVG